MTVKNILFKIDLVGNGIVNMDSKEQKWAYLNESGSMKNMFTKYENVNYAKKNFYKDENGDLLYKIKISSDCLKHDMYKDEVIAQSPKIAVEDAVLYAFIASPMSIARGYMFANKKETLKRRGALSICDAEQTCRAVSTLEFCSKSGEKTSNDGESDKGDTTIFKKETVGDIKYSSIGDIDLSALQFISTDQVFDRFAFNPDKFSMYKAFLNMRMKNFNSELGYYQLNGSAIDIPEQGIKLSNENVLDLVKITLKKMLAINIKRRGSFAKVSALKIKLIENPVEELLSGNDNWIELKSFEDIDKLDFVVEDFYGFVELAEAMKRREAIEEAYKAEKLKDKAEKLDKDSKKAAFKKAKENKDAE